MVCTMLCELGCRQENVLTDGEGSGEECEVTDECAMLLNAEGGSTLHKVPKATAATHKHGMLLVASTRVLHPFCYAY